MEHTQTRARSAPPSPVAVPNRNLIATAAVVMQICLGIIYAWTVFRGPLATAYGWDKTQTLAPYRWSTLFFTIAMVVAGFWQDRAGPKLVGSVGGVLLGFGCLLAGLMGSTPGGLIFAYGVIGGLGVGFAYVTPIATCVKWFPDKRGMVVGLAVMGFGLGPLVFGPLLKELMGSDPAQFTTTIPRTFLILSALLFVMVTGAAQFYQVPPKGWKPEGWNPPAAAAGSKTDYSTAAMLGTLPFWVAWLIYYFGSGIGLTVIGEAAQIIGEVASSGAVISATAAVGVIAAFNGAGRLIWGKVSDALGRTRAMLGMCAVYAIMNAVVLPASSSFAPVLLALCCVAMCYGGFLAIMPSLTADYWGSKNIGANYGILFSAWGLAGFTIPGYFASILEKAKQAGNLRAGYNEVFQIVAVLAVVSALLVLVCKRPRQA